MNFKIGLLALAGMIGIDSISAAASYSSGPCMNTVWSNTENSGTELSCNANEVATTLLGIDGPTACKKGDIIVVNITTSIYFRASRYDFAIYTLTDNNGASDPIFGSECAVDILGSADAAFAPDHIQELDNDSCFDVVANSGWTLEQYSFQDNLHVPCEGEPGTTTQTVHLQNCFSWRTNGQNEHCDTEGAYPGASSKCDCGSMDLGILIYEEQPPSMVPSSAPSVSFAPSKLPSSVPSISKSPSSAPSNVPTISSNPSALPTDAPSLSSSPTNQPSGSPSQSSQPTTEPSLAPTESSAPSSFPSSSPSLSALPSSVPSLAPSTSSAPTSQPSLNPSTSGSPSSEPSLNPTESAAPSAQPSDKPSVSSAPTSQPSDKPSLSAEPTSQPSLNPSTSGSPTSQPSMNPTESAAPSSQPSDKPSVSSAPTSQPSDKPSLSAEPTSQPSSNPSLSSQPSTEPSMFPSVSKEPSTEPSLNPSLSSAPTSQPSQYPSLSTAPSSAPSDSPSISSSPSSEPSVNPTTSTAPSGEPSTSPSVSKMPTTQPSSSPSTSTAPSSFPTSSPSISSAPSDVPSESPTLSTAPSSYPTAIPSESPSSSPTSVASVGGVVWEDSNGDGLIDVGEAVLPNKQLSLLDETGNVVKTTISAPDGSYSFTGVLPDTYSITVVSGEEFLFSPVMSGGNTMRSTTLVGGYNLMSQASSGAGISDPITLSGGEERDDMHAGVYIPIMIGNKVWNDLNGNGIQEEGEEGIEGVTVALLDGSGLVVETTETDTAGYYKFTGLSPGSYSVQFELPAGYSFTQSAAVLGDIQLEGLPLASADGSFLLADVTSDANAETGKTEQVSVVSGDVNLSLDAGVFLPAKILGFVWHDLNADGIQQEGEEGIEGAVITLFNDDSVSFGVAVSDASGQYIFENLRPDSYYGFFEAPNEEYLMSPQGQGESDTDSDFDPDSHSNSLVALLSGDESRGSFDAGLYKLAKVGDFVWLDTAADGIQDPDEIGFPFPVTINLYNKYNELQATTISNETGAYLFEDLVPGYYEIEFIMEEGDILSPPFRGNNEELDSNVDPTTKRAEVTLVSGEENFSVDAGIIANAPYYPDWAWDVQVCTNDGFDPEWMTTNNEGEQIYLYRNKETCCQNHFWWRMTQCMANEEYKFYRNGEICDSKIEFEDWESNSPAEWTDTKLFDTLDECCANLFSYDYSGCMARSPVMFKFEFCFDVGSLLPPIDCQTADIYANVLEDAVNLGLGEGSDANITRVGEASLTKVDGSTQCGGSLEGQDFINDQTGTIGEPDLSNLPESTTICGVITTESYDCTEDECLNVIYQNLVSSLSTYIDDGSFTANLNNLATVRLPPVQELQVADATEESLTTFNLLLPTTISSQLGDLKYFKDNQSCGQKTAFASWEVKYDTLLDCCSANFNWMLEECCNEGGGCGGLNNEPPPVSPPPTPLPSMPPTNGPTSPPTNPPPPAPSSPPTKLPTPAPSMPPTSGPTSPATNAPTPLPSVPPTSGPTSPPTDAPPTPSSPPTNAPTPLPTTPLPTPNPSNQPTSAPQTPNPTNPNLPTTAPTGEPVMRYFADQSVGAEQLCSLKPITAFESWETPYTDLKECCTNKFSWDYQNCCSAEGLGGCGDPPSVERYYPTWQEGKLCQSKTNFEGWETTFETLSDCCMSQFGYMYDACCQSDGMGGCA